MLFGIFLFIFVVVCVLLCLLVLIQSDKGGGISGAIGGGLAGASNMFGTQDTANILTKLTTGFAIAFGGLCIIISLFLSHPSEKQQRSMLKERADKRQDFSPSSVLQGQQTLPLAAPKGSGAAAGPGPVPATPATAPQQNAAQKALPSQVPSGSSLPALPKSPTAPPPATKTEKAR